MTTSAWQLGQCIFPNGTSAYLNPALGESGPSFNESAYYNQLATNLTSYYWYGWSEGLSALDILSRNENVYPFGYGSENVTSYFYSKELVASIPQQGVVFTVGPAKGGGVHGVVRRGLPPDFGQYYRRSLMQDNNSEAGGNMTLLLTIILSLLVAITCGLGVIVAVIFFGLK